MSCGASSPTPSACCSPGATTCTPEGCASASSGGAGSASRAGSATTSRTPRRSPAANHGMTLTFAFDYDGRAELTAAMAAIAEEVRDGARKVGGDRRATARRPPLRPRHARPRPARAHRRASTRISNFLLWQAAYSEFVFTDVALARLPPRRPLRRRRRVPAPRTPLRRRRPHLSPNIRHYECADVSVLTDVRTGTANYTGVVNLYRDQGVVLRTIKLGETDRIVTILTQGHGKIRAVAKGVRKPGSRFGARLEPDEPRRAAVLPGPRARRRHPDRDHRRQPGAPRALRLPHPRGLDARGHRPGRPGARAQPRALPHARRRAAHARRAPARRS